MGNIYVGGEPETSCVSMSMYNSYNVHKENYHSSSPKMWRVWSNKPWIWAIWRLYKAYNNSSIPKKRGSLAWKTYSSWLQLTKSDKSETHCQECLPMSGIMEILCISIFHISSVCFCSFCLFDILEMR